MLCSVLGTTGACTSLCSSHASSRRSEIKERFCRGERRLNGDRMSRQGRSAVSHVCVCVGFAMS